MAQAECTPGTVLVANRATSRGLGSRSVGSPMDFCAGSTRGPRGAVRGGGTALAASHGAGVRSSTPSKAAAGACNAESASPMPGQRRDHLGANTEVSFRDQQLIGEIEILHQPQQASRSRISRSRSITARKWSRKALFFRLRSMCSAIASRTTARSDRVLGPERVARDAGGPRGEAVVSVVWSP
jgi:hypothetical protein